MFVLSDAVTTVGRTEANSIVLSCQKISKTHASITRTGFLIFSGLIKEKGKERKHSLIADREMPTYSVTDLNSSNGVRLNEKAIHPGTPYILSQGDILTIGSVVLTFATPNSPTRTPAQDYLELVTILPAEKRYDDTMTIRAELQPSQEDFHKVGDVADIETLKEDYEKLRLAYELSKVSLTNDITQLLAKALDLVFELVPVDRGVVLLVDHSTHIMSTHYVKLRAGKANETREILLSSTIVNKVLHSRSSLITSDAYEDPSLGKAASIKYAQIRSVICVPLIAHDRVWFEVTY